MATVSALTSSVLRVKVLAEEVEQSFLNGDQYDDC